LRRRVPTLIAGRTVGDTPGISFAGIYASYRNMGDPNFTTVPAGVPVYAFEDFRVQSAEPVSSTLAFTPAALSYTVMQGGSTAPQTATLSASQGTPAVRSPRRPTATGSPCRPAGWAPSPSGINAAA
jgi:hypothetical protein